MTAVEALRNKAENEVLGFEIERLEFCEITFI